MSSIETMRPPSGSSATSAFNNVVFPEPVPPAISTLPPDCNTRRASSTTTDDTEPAATNSAIVNARPPNRRIVIAAHDDAGGLQIATREPSPSRPSMMGSVCGSCPSGARDLDRRPEHRRLV